MVKRVIEVWEEPNSVTMFVRGSGGRKLLGPNACLLRTFEAESTFEAFATHNRLMGWGDWTPVDGVPDTPFTDTDPPLEDEPE